MKITQTITMPIIAAAFAVTFAVSGNAAAPSPAPQPAATPATQPDDPAKVAAAKEFIKMFHPQTDPQVAGAMVDKGMPNMIANAKMQNPKLDVKQFEQTTRARILDNITKTLDMQAHVVSRHFTLDELNAFVTFFQTPAGRKLTAEQPKIQMDIMQERRRQMVQGAMQMGKPAPVKPSGATSGEPAHK
jgi:hypothetical protein